MKSKRNHPAFTLTEILIALALVAVLLIGISRIFAITSQTISTGQALSRAVRTQKTIAQQLSADIVGVLPTSANLRPYSGMMPANDAGDPDAGMPFLQICNFRVPTYLNEAAYRADSVAPPAVMAAVNTTTYRDLSRAVRGIDADKNGTEALTQINLTNGEMTPLFFYGDRNFRCDTIAFFSRGQFRSQTGVSGRIARVANTVGTGTNSLQSELQSSEAYIWYGQGRVFNSNPKALDRSAGFKAPGEWPITGEPNPNNLFADQFILCRMQLLLVEPTDHDNRLGSWKPSDSNTSANDYDDGGADRKLAEDNTVTASGDPDQPVIFLQRKWWNPTAHHITNNKANWQDRPRPFPSPFNTTDPVVIYQRDTATSQFGRDYTLYTNDQTTSAGTSATSGLSTSPYQTAFGRTDVAGVGSRQLRQRIRFLEQYDIDYPFSQATGDKDEWWQKMFVSHNTRFWANPFVSTAGFTANEPSINAKSLAQRQQILANGVSQFIVEFTGDFLTQRTDLTPASRFGEVTAITPDGVPDFVATASGGRLTRWYGLPRDADNSGTIPATPATARTSIDVLPVSRIVPATLFTDPTIKWMPFEKTDLNPTPPATLQPPSPVPVNNDYAQNLDEPTSASSPNGTGYVCVWGARDFETTYDIAPPSPPGVTHTPKLIRGGYPTMIRFIIDVRDENGKLAEPVTQELVYRVPDEGAVVPD